MGSKEDVAARIDADTRIKIEEMNNQVAAHKDAVSLLLCIYENIDSFSLLHCYN